MINNTLTNIYIWLVNLYTATELKIIAFSSILGAIFIDAIGGLDIQITALFKLMIADYTTGLIAAYRTKTIGSKKGTTGLFKKIAILCAVMLANTVDNAFAINTARHMAICGFAGIEVFSLIENIDRIGWGKYIPEFLRNAFIQIRKEKGV
ncbi:hypothetical protein SRRS_07330 [Sporomusa rhizae]|uniref:phage holin family protein n=1 Tax=Sporomusa rhizae TaxID=357999 RepID=UPI00352A192E